MNQFVIVPVNDAISPLQPEDIRGAKERINQFMVGNRTYVEVDDQPALTGKFDLELARRRCPSFDKFRRDFEKLINPKRQAMKGY